MYTNLQNNLNNNTPNYTAPFLWLHGESHEALLNEIKHIYECGIHAVCLESRTHEQFCEQKWYDDIKFIFDECKKLNMRVWILDDKHFPTGYANGIYKDKYKDLRPWTIYESHIDICGPVKDGFVLADMHKINESSKIIAAVALKHIPNTDNYTDDVYTLTDGLHGDSLYLTLPEGMWRIVFLIKTRGGVISDRADYCDMLNPKSVDAFVSEVYEGHYKNLKEYFGNTFLGFFSDEPSFNNITARTKAVETGTVYTHHPWNDDVYDKLNKIYNGNADKYLAGIWFNIENNISNSARYEYMNIISNEYKNNFTDKLGTWCKNHNIEYIGHVIEDNNIHTKTGMGAAHYFRAIDGQHMSGVDVVLHQLVPGLIECNNAGLVSYWHMNSKFFNYVLAKLGASSAAIDPKKKGRAMCEIFGAYGWAEDTKIMKYLCDHMLVRGINYFVPHAFSPKPNDEDCPPNFYDNGGNPQYKYFKYIISYLNRCSHMLNGGKHIVHCAVLYDAEFRWVNKRYLPVEDIAKELYDNKIDYDIIPADIIDKTDDDGNAYINRYDVLLVPYSEHIPQAIKSKIENANIKTYTVVPNGYAKCDGAVELNGIAKILGDKYADVYCSENHKFLRYYHYLNNNAHIYMFSNEDTLKTVNTKITLAKFDGGDFIIYNAFENTACRAYSKDGSINLTLPPYNSVMIIFGDVPYDNIKPACDISVVKSTTLNVPLEISVKKESEKEFTYYKTTTTPESITLYSALPCFSGDIKYTAQIEFEQKNAIIDLGDKTGGAAVLYLNGKKCGVKLFPPYTFNVSEFIKDGLNTLDITVSNHNGYQKRDKFSKFLLFEPSGLTENIKIHYFK